MRAAPVSVSEGGLGADSLYRLQWLVCRHSEAITELAAELTSAHANILNAATPSVPLAPLTGAGSTTSERLRRASHAEGRQASHAESAVAVEKCAPDPVCAPAWSDGGERFNNFVGAGKVNAGAKCASACSSNDLGRFSHVVGAMTAKVPHPAVPDEATTPEDATDASPAARSRTTSSQSRKVLASASTRHWGKVRASVHEKLWADVTEISRAQQQSGRIFADAEALKEAIRETLTEEQFDLASCYHRTGFSQAVVRSHAFEVGSLAMVCLSSLWMGVEIEYNKSIGLFGAHPVFQVMAQVFCVFFVGEILVRFRAFRDKRDVRKDPWFVFDAVLVALVVLETWVLSTVAALLDMDGTAASNIRIVVIFRGVRILRVLRLARVVRELPELMVIVRGIAIAIRGIAIIIVLLSFIVYLGAIVFRVLLDSTGVGRDYFCSIPSAMGTLLLELTLNGSRGTGIIRLAHDEHPLFSLLLLVFVVFSNVTVMGVLSGMLVQTVRAVAEIEKEEKTVKSMQSTMNNVWNVIALHDRNKDDMICMKELQTLLLDRDVAQVLQSMDVDLEGLGNVAHFVFEEHDGALTKGQFKRMVLDLRNKQAAKVKDHVETRKFINSQLKKTGLLRRESAATATASGLAVDLR